MVYVLVVGWKRVGSQFPNQGLNLPTPALEGGDFTADSEGGPRTAPFDAAGSGRVDRRGSKVACFLPVPPGGPRDLRSGQTRPPLPSGSPALAGGGPAPFPSTTATGRPGREAVVLK